MTARDVASGEHHDHERRPDCQRRDHTRSGANAGASNCEDKEEGSDEFCYVFVHSFRFVRCIVVCY